MATEKQLRFSKAWVKEVEKGIFRLTSYITDVAEYNRNTKVLTVFPHWDCSPTTTRHVGKFMEDYAGVYGSAPCIRKGLLPNGITVVKDFS